MRRAAADPVIVDAKRRMRLAATLQRRAVAVLLPALAALSAHPDVKATERRLRAGRPVRESLTLAHWLRGSLQGVLEDAPFEEAGDWLEGDATGKVEASMVQFIETEERDAATFARRRQRQEASRAAA